MLRRDESFQILEKINDNAYKVELLSEYSISVTYNVSDISLLDVGDDSREESFKKKGNDAILASTPRDPLKVPLGLVTRLRAKRFNEAINILLQDTWAKMDFGMISNNKEQALINLIHAQEGLIRELSNITERLEYEDSNLSVLAFYHYFSHN
jgi:hypothetical protein